MLPAQLARLDAMARGEARTTAEYGLSEADCQALDALLAERTALREALHGLLSLLRCILAMAEEQGDVIFLPMDERHEVRMARAALGETT